MSVTEIINLLEVDAETPIKFDQDISNEDLENELGKIIKEAEQDSDIEDDIQVIQPVSEPEVEQPKVVQVNEEEEFTTITERDVQKLVEQFTQEIQKLRLPPRSAILNILGEIRKVNDLKNLIQNRYISNCLIMFSKRQLLLKGNRKEFHDGNTEYDFRYSNTQFKVVRR